MSFFAAIPVVSLFAFAFATLEVEVEVEVVLLFLSAPPGVTTAEGFKTAFTSLVTTLLSATEASFKFTLHNVLINETRLEGSGGGIPAENTLCTSGTAGCTVDCTVGVGTAGRGRSEDVLLLAGAAISGLFWLLFVLLFMLSRNTARLIVPINTAN